MAESRQLAVIMFTDIVGYTGIMQDDEAQALIQMNRFRAELNSNVEKFTGEVIQYYGDGSLVIFRNSVDAVNCAKTLQEIFNAEPKVPVRIGIHLGDIIKKDGNIFGNCVNITSRIESMGLPGSVLLSEPVKEQIKNKPEILFTSLGEFEFKNVTDPMEIFALTMGNLPAISRADLNGKFKERSTIQSIAVLPFVNMSNDPEQEYFSDGMAEEIINSLTHLKDLNVAGRTSSFQFKGKNIDLREVGKKLSVTCVLEGSVRKQGNRLRITAQLIKVDDGYHLWSEKYDRDINDVFAIQDEIALAITEKLQVTLLKKDRDLITKSYTQNTEAYELYLKGKFYLTRRGASMLTSMECFIKAIHIDPDFALAHSAYAEANLLIATYALVIPTKVMARAKESAEKALQLDPDLSQPYCSLGYYYTCVDWNWPKAKENFLKCIELNPKYAEGHVRYAWNYLACVEGNFEAAIKHGETAIKLEPLSSICYANYALVLQSAGKFKEAITASKTGIELDANSFACHVYLASSQMSLQQYEESISSYKVAVKLSNRHPFPVNGLIWTYCLSGQAEKAIKLMNELRERAVTEYIANTLTGISAAYLGNLDEALDYLEKAFNDKDPLIILLKYQHWVTPTLRADYRFQKLLQKIGFPD